MQIQTHYAALGLAPNAPAPVIRAAYKALVLIHHPDKTVHLTAEERSSHSAIFREVQKAFDVLGNPSLKASYDVELSHHHGEIDSQRSTFHHADRSRRTPTSTPHRQPSIRLTKPEERAAMKAKTSSELAHLRDQRAQRDAEEATMSLQDLKFMAKAWTELFEENKDDAVLRAHCQIMMYEYERKAQAQQMQREEWFADLSTPKKTSSSTSSPPNAPRKSSSLRPTPFPGTPTPSSRATQRKRATDNAVRARARAQARVDEKTSLETVRREQRDARAAAVRAQNEKQKRRVEALAAQDAERIAKARTKAAAAPKRTLGVRFPESDDSTKCSGEKAGTKKTCGKCGAAHASLLQWKKCGREAVERGGDESFFLVV